MANKPIIKNLVLSGVTTFCGFISGTVVIMVLGRMLPVNIFGEIVFAYTFATLAQLIPSYGFPLLVIVEVAQKHLEPAKAIVNVLAVQIFLSILTVAGLALLIRIANISINSSLILIFMVSGILNSFSTVISSVNKGQNDFSVEVKVAISQMISLCILIFMAMMVLPKSSMLIGWVMLTSNLVGLIIALILIKPLFMGDSSLLPDAGTMGKLLKIGFPFAIQLIFGTLYFQIDTLIIGKLTGMEAVGFYQAATRIVFAVFPLALIINNVFYPRLAAVYNPDTQNYQTSDGYKMMFLLLLISIILTIFLIVFAQPVVYLIYGPKMVPSIPVLQVFSLILLFRFVAGGLGILLITCQKQIFLVIAAIIATVTNLILNFIWVPSYGIISSAWANVITHLIILSIYLFAFSFRSKIRLPQNITIWKCS